MRFVGPFGLAVSFSVLSWLAPEVGFVSGVARAADPAAEQLYRAGQKAAAAQDWATACTDFRDSEAREHAPGTVLNLAVCEEKLGQLVQAKEHFSAAGKQFRRGDARVVYATRQAAAIDLRLARLTMRGGDSLPADASLERDGVAVDLAPVRQAGAAGQVVPLDPGVHVLVVRAPGHADAHTEVKLAEGARAEVTLSLGAAPDRSATTFAPAPGGALAPVASAAPTAPPAFTTAASGAPAASSADGGSSLRTLGFVATAVGGAGLAFGFVAGAVTLSKKSATDDNCSASTCNAAGASAESSGKTWSAVSTVGVIAGAAVLATGITLLVVAPRDPEHAATGGLRLTRVGLAPATGGASLGLAGSF